MALSRKSSCEIFSEPASFEGKKTLDSRLVGLMALAAGVPIGILAGRATFRAFASQLGLVATPLVPVVAVALVAVALLVIANVAASLPAHRARHIPLSTLLREE